MLQLTHISSNFVQQSLRDVQIGLALLNGLMFVTSVCSYKTLISISDTQNIVEEVFLQMGSIGLPEDVCVLVGIAAADGVEACAVSWWSE